MLSLLLILPLVALAAAAPSPEKRATLATVYSKCSESKAVALTFDDVRLVFFRDAGSCAEVLQGPYKFESVSVFGGWV